MPRKKEEQKVVINYQPHKYQYGIHIDPHRYRVVCAGRRMGKCHEKGTNIIKANGEIVPVENIKIGDWLISPTGKFNKVLSLSKGYGKMFEIKPRIGKSFFVNAYHQLSLLESFGINSSKRRIINISVEDYLSRIKKSKKFQKRTFLYRPSKPISFKNTYTPKFSPYLLGLWIADGRKNRFSFSVNNNDSEISKEIYDFSKKYKNSYISKGNIQKSSSDLSINFGKGKKNYFIQYLKELGIYNNKHIPEVLYRMSIIDRLNFIAGYIDGDGCLNHGNSDCYSTSTSIQILADGIEFMVRSLGFSVNKKNRDRFDNRTNKIYHSIELLIGGPIDNIPVRLARKKSINYNRHNFLNKISFDVKENIDNDFYGFELSGDHLYLLEDFIATHNSVCARQEIIRKALMWTPDKKIISGGIARTPRFWIVSPTLKQGRNNHWNEMKREIPLELIVKRQGKYRINESELEMELINGVIISIKGADNPDGLRGSGLCGVVMDECAFMKPEVWTQIIQPMLIDTNGWALFISTPKGYNWFHTIYQQGIENSKTYSPEWKSWHYTSYDNPTFDEEQLLDIDKQKALLPHEEFEQEFMASFVTFKDLIYKDFDFEKHVIEPFDLDPGKYTFYRSIDFGFKHPTGCLWIAVDKEDKWYIFDEYRQAEVSSEQNAGVIKSIHPEFTYEATFGDPSAAQLIEDYDRLGIYITPASKMMKTSLTQWVNMGIGKVTEKLKLKPNKNGEMVPDLYIFNNCEHLIEELQGYRWKEQPDSTKAIAGQPVKIKDDLCLDGNSEILTTKGLIKIKNIKIGNYVETPFGFKRVVAHRLTNEKAKVLEVKFNNGEKIVGTLNHKIWKGNNFVRLDSLRYGDVIKICKLSQIQDSVPIIVKVLGAENLSEILKRERVWCVQNFLKLISIIKPKRVVTSVLEVCSVKQLKKEIPVYNISVEGGVYNCCGNIHSNCDPLRYAAISITEPFSKSGDNYNFPKEELFPQGMYI